METQLHHVLSIINLKTLFLRRLLFFETRRNGKLTPPTKWQIRYDFCKYGNFFILKRKGEMEKGIKLNGCSTNDLKTFLLYASVDFFFDHNKLVFLSEKLVLMK